LTIEKPGLAERLLAEAIQQLEARGLIRAIWRIQQSSKRRPRTDEEEGRSMDRTTSYEAAALIAGAI
jgi:hypothetical protein